jgi:hypothetical protein
MPAVHNAVNYLREVLQSQREENIPCIWTLVFVMLTEQNDCSKCDGRV